MWNSISPDEMDVRKMTFDGIPNKTIAVRMGTSQRTIESRRHRLFAKLDSKSLPMVIQRVCEWKQLQRELGGPT
jgi:FixJ family two-component response regulator